MKRASLVLKSRKTGMGRVRVEDRVEAGPRAVPSSRTTASALSNVDATRHMTMWFLNM